MNKRVKEKLTLFYRIYFFTETIDDKVQFDINHKNIIKD